MSGTALPSALILGLPSGIALVAYLFAVLLGEPRERPSSRPLPAVLVLGWIAHGLAIVVDVSGFGGDQEGARFGFAPALSSTVWLVLAVYLVESRFLPLPGVRRVLAGIASVVVVLAWAFPAETPPQAPSPWAPLHWALGFVSYGLFGAAVLHAAMLGRAERALRGGGGGVPIGPAGSPRATTTDAGPPLLRLERLTFRFVGVGFVALSAALLLGARSGLGGGAAWRWTDQKIVFSLLGWIVFAGLLLGRRTFGWRGPAATRSVYAGAALLLLGYVGSRFASEVLARGAA